MFLLDLSDECMQGLAGGGRLHERFPDEEAAEARLAQPAEGVRTGNAAFGNQQGMPGRGCLSGELFGQTEGVLHIRVEAAQVAVVDAREVGPWADVVQLLVRVYLQQHFQAEGVRFVRQRIALRPGQAGGDEQHGIGSHQSGLQELVGVDDEVFAQDGQAGQRAGGLQVGQGAAEVGFVRQDGEGGGAVLFVSLHYFAGVCLGIYPAFRGGAAFELGNDARGRGGERPAEAAGGGIFPQEFFHLQAQDFRRDGLFLPGYFGAFGGYDVG